MYVTTVFFNILIKQHISNLKPLIFYIVINSSFITFKEDRPWPSRIFVISDCVIFSDIKIAIKLN